MTRRLAVPAALVACMTVGAFAGALTAVALDRWLNDYLGGT